MSHVVDGGAHSTSRVVRGLAATMPVLLVGTIAMSTLNLGSPAPAHRAKSNNAHPKRSAVPTVAATISVAAPVDAVAPTGQIVLASVSTPATYTVRPGDTISGIADRFGLSTASVLALNGLSWKSLIFPRQVLRLTRAAAPIIAPPASSPTLAAKPSTATYKIASGDTVTRIAKKFGVSVPSLLAANHLVASSIIYAGRTLVIPTAHTVGTAPAQLGTPMPVPSTSIADNARVIIAVGRSRGVPSFGIVVALAAALQESGLQNLGYGDRDSVGLFQQRPSAGWGSVAQLENPTYAAELFYGGRSNPNRGKTRGLLDIPGWQSMTVTQAAQAVQISAYPDGYAKWEASARALLNKLGR